VGREERSAPRTPIVLYEYQKKELQRLQLVID
jgi:hypothetical protein